MIYDVLGNQIDIDGVRTNFNTPKVANNYIVEYQNRFSHYNFSLVTEMTDRLVEKSFISARLYYDLGYYKSAILALRNSIIDFPETKYREELMFLILKSSYLLADGSIPSKQRERYQTTVDEYYSFIGEFPEGTHSKEARRRYEASNKFLENTNKQS